MFQGPFCPRITLFHVLLPTRPVPKQLEKERKECMFRFPPPPQPFRFSLPIYFPASISAHSTSTRMSHSCTFFHPQAFLLPRWSGRGKGGSSTQLGTELLMYLPCRSMNLKMRTCFLSSRTLLANGTVRNELSLPSVDRSYLHDSLSCEARNTNLTRPVVTTVIVDMNFPPARVR